MKTLRKWAMVRWLDAVAVAPSAPMAKTRICMQIEVTGRMKYGSGRVKSVTQLNPPSWSWGRGRVASLRRPKKRPRKSGMDTMGRIMERKGETS